jgi:hypothetical protein
MPSATTLGGKSAAAARAAWVASLGQPPLADVAGASEALLRLEMAAEVPTPAAHLDARRALQLRLLTRRNDPAPAQTWGHDMAKVLTVAYADESAQRLQAVLKVLLRR